MRRIAMSPRPNWTHRVEEVGLLYHSTGASDAPYWNESARYEFTAGEIDELEAATRELHDRCMEAVAHVVRHKRYEELGISSTAIPLIEDSWARNASTIYGRLDLAYDGWGPPRLLEYNADTPTALLEAAVVQWYWLQDVDASRDQFNSIHERLVAAWASVAVPDRVLHCVSMPHPEDELTVAYIREVAQQGGVDTIQLTMREIGWNSDSRRFVDSEGRWIRTVFKLYPWEWLLQDRFGQHLGPTAMETQWIEPAWKLILSSKGILPLLWELFPKHPNLVASYLSPKGLRRYVKKPLFSRHGSNVEMIVDGDCVARGADHHYGAEGYIYQEMVDLPRYNGYFPILGSWVIGNEPGGIGIRESSELITSDASSFVPHWFA